MDVSHVIFERLSALKLFLTNFALIMLVIAVLIWFLSGMNVQVIVNAFQLGKTFITYFAPLWFLSCRNMQVM